MIPPQRFRIATVALGHRTQPRAATKATHGTVPAASDDATGMKEVNRIVPGFVAR